MIRRRALLIGLLSVWPLTALAQGRFAIFQVAGSVAGHLLLETADKLILENGSGFLLLEH
jgi:hypothetical protein